MEKGTLQFLWLVLMCQTTSPDQDHMGIALDFMNSDHWDHPVALPRDTGDEGQSCAAVQPRASDIIKRLFAVLPYFDKEHANSAFLHRLRGSIYGMSQHGDALDREVACFAAALAPAILLQHHRDPWCLLERFHRAIRFFQASHPTSKRSSLKLLQNLRSLNGKLRHFIEDLVHDPRRATADFDEDGSRSTTAVDLGGEDDEPRDKGDVRYLKELIKTLG